MKKLVLLIIVVLCSYNLYAQVLSDVRFADFYFKLSEAIFADKNDENIVYCPFNTVMNIDLMLNGMDEESQRKVLNSMGLDDYSICDLNKFVADELLRFDDHGSYYNISSYSILWKKKNLEFESDYEKFLESIGLSMILSSSGESDVDFVSNVYYQDRWGIQPTDYVKNVFHNNNGKFVRVSMMDKLGGYLIHMKDFDIIHIPFSMAPKSDYPYSLSRSPLYYMICFFPHDTFDCTSLNAQTLLEEEKMLWDQKYELCHIAMPRFKIGQRMCMDSYLKSITGLDLQSDFVLSKMIKNECVSVPSMYQSATFQLYDLGVEAMDTKKRCKNEVKKNYVDFTVEHPFRFVIMNSELDILLIGCVRNLEGEEVNMTAINPVNVSEKSSNEIYDLYGRKCSSMSKAGIYVVNGKKVMVK